MALDQLLRDAKEGKNPKLDHYTVTGLIGQGSVFSVLKGYDTDLADEPEYTHALKVAKNGHEGKLREHLKLMMKLKHPNIPKVVEAEFDTEIPYVAEELLEKTLLDEVISYDGKLPEEKIRQYASQLFDVVEHVHKKGIVHTDINPVNLLIKGDKIYLTDFNLTGEKEPEQEEEKQEDLSLLHSLKTLESLSRGTGEGERKTNPFWPPECIDPDKFDFDKKGRDDLYSLSAVLYFMLTGKVFPGRIPKDPKQFNPELEHNYSEFFERAGKLTIDDRFQNVPEMRKLWKSSAKDMFGGGLIVYRVEHYAGMRNEYYLQFVEVKNDKLVKGDKSVIDRALIHLKDVCLLPGTKKLALYLSEKTGSANPKYSHNIKIMDLENLEKPFSSFFSKHYWDDEGKYFLDRIFCTEDGKILLNNSTDGSVKKVNIEKNRLSVCYGDLKDFDVDDVGNRTLSPNGKYIVTDHNKSINVVSREEANVPLFQKKLGQGTRAFWLDITNLSKETLRKKSKVKQSKPEYKSWLSRLFSRKK